MSIQRVAAEIGVAHTTPQARLGELYIDDDGNHFRYMQADGAVTADLLYSYRPTTWQIDAPIKLNVVPAATGAVPCCASPVTLADNEYAFVFVGPGTVTLTTAGDVAIDVPIYGVNGDGTVDDAATAVILNGLTCPVAITGATTGSFYACYGLCAVDLA